MLNCIKKYISVWERRGYKNGIPDEADSVLESYNLVPSYKLLCQAIIRNDIHLSGLGGKRPKSFYYEQIKGEELRNRGSKNLYTYIQLVFAWRIN